MSMPVNLFENINGTYQPPQMNLLGSAKVQNSNPVRYNENELGKNNPVVKVNISAEGLRALHGSKLPGSVDIKAEQEQIRYISEHQPTESYYNRMSREMSNALEQKRAENDGSLTIEDREDALMSSFQSIADEIVKGYENGARVRFVEAPDSEDGYRKLTKEDELEILQKEFDDLSEAKFGKKHQEEAEAIAKSLDALHKIMEENGKATTAKKYDPIKMPDDFLERLLRKSRMFIANL